MGDLAVKQPHLGRETIGLLHRIVECGADGLSQDDIEPYLLVRLLRCGYIRRADPSAAVFVATAAGLERSRFETLMSRRRDEERERRDIIRGRMQAMVERMELDRPPAPLPALRDLPGYRERIAPPWQQPQLPMLRSRALPPPQEQRPLAAPEDALRVIRDGEQRTRREQNFLGAAEARPRDIEGADWQIEHVGRLPSKRETAEAAAHDDPVAAEPVPIIDEQEPGGALLEDTVWQDEAAGPPRNKWRRQAVVIGAVAAVLVAAEPAYQYVFAPGKPDPHQAADPSPAPAAAAQHALLAVAASPTAAPAVADEPNTAAPAHPLANARTAPEKADHPAAKTMTAMAAAVPAAPAPSHAPALSYDAPAMPHVAPPLPHAVAALPTAAGDHRTSGTNGATAADTQRAAEAPPPPAPAAPAPSAGTRSMSPQPEPPQPAPPQANRATAPHPSQEGAATAPTEPARPAQRAAAPAQPPATAAASPPPHANAPQTEAAAATMPPERATPPTPTATPAAVESPSAPAAPVTTATSGYAMSVPAVSGPFQMLTPYPAALPEMQPRTAAPPPAPLAGAAPAPGGANPPPATVHQPPASAAPLPQQEATAPPPAIITTPLPEPIARPAVTLRDERRTEHPAGAPRIRGVAAAATPKASVPPPAPPEPHDAAQNDDLTRVLTRLRTGEVGDDVVVDRLNTLSLAAARQGRPFRPRPTDGWPTPARSSREAHSATAASAIFTP